MATSDPIVIVGYARTPLGAFQGQFASLTATQLGSIAIKAAVARAGLQPQQINAVIMGCVLSAGLGQAPARQAALGADLAVSTVCTTVNKVCGSGMQAVMSAHDILLSSSNTNHIIVAGGMESMTNAPYYLDKARSGYRMGNAQIYDHMLVDGLEDAYSKKSMGYFADNTASKLGISRAEQDAFALRSLLLCKQAISDGWLAAEVTPVTVELKSGSETITTDEIPLRAKPDKIPQLKPAFNPNGSVTAANSSSIADGSAALVLMRQSTANGLGLKPLAKILGHVACAKDPEWFTTAPVNAIQTLLKNLNFRLDDIDLFEINEAFAVVVLATISELNIDINKVNVNGGACALGHPIGASGARVLCTLITALQRNSKKVGLATVCIGGGEATAIAIELL